MKFTRLSALALFLALVTFSGIHTCTAKSKKKTDAPQKISEVTAPTAGNKVEVSDCKPHRILNGVHTFHCKVVQ